MDNFGEQKRKINLKILDLKDKNALTSLFAILIKVDKRKNPKLYKDKNLTRSA
ncbi:MAG TPA: hypothetical protein VGC58_02120 [Candidatus Paceibacterota bacterium]